MAGAHRAGRREDRSGSGEVDEPWLHTPTRSSGAVGHGAAGDRAVGEGAVEHGAGPRTGGVGVRVDREGPAVRGYSVGRLLGRGGSSSVWRAQEEGGGDVVALKVLARTVGGDVVGRRRLEREAGLLAALEHPHLLALRALTQTAEDQPRPVLVLDHAPGGSLAALVAARGRLDPGEVVTVLVPLAEALTDLHRRGVVHGDVAPGNVLFAAKGMPLLADLGVGDLLGCGRPLDLGRPGVPAGPDDASSEPPGFELLGGDVDQDDTEVALTSGYADPQRSAGGPTTPAGDVYGLAAAAWHALTALQPGPAGDRPPLLPLVPDAPRALVELLEDCLEADPARRPDTADVAVRAFAAAEAEPVRLVPTDPWADPAEVITHRIRADAAGAGRSPDPEPVPAQGRRWRAPVAVLAALTLLGVAGAVAVELLWSGLPPSRPQAPPVPAAAPAVAEEPVVEEAVDEQAPPVSSREPVTGAPTQDPTGLQEGAVHALDDVLEAALAGPDPAAAVPALAALRARAFATGDRAALLRADSAGSSAFARDDAALQALADEGRRLSGLGFEVLSATPGIGDEDGSVPVAVRVRTTAHQVVADDGRVHAQVPESEPVDAVLVLVHEAGAWRVREVV